MRALRPYVVVSLLFVLVAALPALVPVGIHHGVAEADNLGAAWQPYDSSQLPASVQAAMFASADAPVARPDALQQGDQVVVDESFDGDFPPEGWEVVDLLPQDDPDNPLPHPVWGQAPCEAATEPTGNVASAWAVGAGVETTCGDPYAQTTFSVLRIPGIDGRNFDGGVQLDMWWKLDMPDPARFVICVAWGSAQGENACYNPRSGSADWTAVTPIVIDTAANKESLTLLFAYQHDGTTDGGGDVTGEYLGAFADNVVLTGLTEPLPTSTPAPTINIPTVAPRVRPAYLPMALQSGTRDDIPPAQSTESGFDVFLGTALDASGHVINRHPAYEFGVMTLCQQVQWWGQTPGAVAKLQWLANGDEIASNDPGVNPQFELTDASGSRPGACIQLSDESGQRQPIPLGTWAVSVFLDGSATAVATTEVTIQEEPPAGSTPIPTRPAPTETPVATPENGCTNVLVNGDMEAGPYQGWSVDTNMDDPNASDITKVIVNDVPTADGSWAARLWAGPTTAERAIHVLYQLAGQELVDPSVLDSATLSFSVGMSTSEQRDGQTRDDDIVAAFLNPANTEQASLVGLASEEELDPNVWYTFSETPNTTAAMAKSPGWDQSLLLLQSDQDKDNPSTFLIDAVSLEVCTTGANPFKASGAERLDLAPWLLQRPSTWLPRSDGGATFTPHPERPFPSLDAASTPSSLAGLTVESVD